jgi:multidrug resistance protein
MPLALLALAVAAFGIGTTEFVIMGLLPDVARDLGVSIPDAGLLITGYALGVVFGAPVLAVGTANMPRKATLLGMTLMFILGNILCALAPNYATLMAARVITALCHGAFFGIGSVVAAGLVAPNKRAQAIAMMFTGLTLANVLGVPLGTALGQYAGWRSTFWAVSVIGVLAAIAQWVWLPKNIAMDKANLASEFKVLGKANVLLALGMSVLASTSLFSVFTYIAPILQDITGVSHAVVVRRWLDRRQHARRAPGGQSPVAFAGRGGIGGRGDSRRLQPDQPLSHSGRDHPGVVGDFCLRTVPDPAIADHRPGPRSTEPRLDPEPERIQPRQCCGCMDWRTGCCQWRGPGGLAVDRCTGQWADRADGAVLHLSPASRCGCA